MKKILLLASLLFMQYNVEAQNPSLLVKGSDALYGSIQQIAMNYTKHHNSTVKVNGQGSSLGILELVDKRIDIATSTRKLTNEELKDFQSQNDSIVQVPICQEAIVILINRSNHVQKLTVSQVKDIFTGKIKNWSEFGGSGNDHMGAIIKLIRGKTSGCYTGFQKSVLGGEKYAIDCEIVPNNLQLKNKVIENKASISFLGFSDVEPSIKKVKVSSDGINFIEPNMGNIQNGSYPLIRECYLIYRKSNEKKVKGFVDYVLKDIGQDIFEENGFIPLANAK